LERKVSIRNAISYIGFVDPSLISSVQKLPLQFVEKLTSTTTVEEGYDMYLMHLFETARESIKNGEHIYQVLLKTQLSRDVLTIITHIPKFKKGGVLISRPP
jgi:hypothetical protein